MSIFQLLKENWVLLSTKQAQVMLDTLPCIIVNAGYVHIHDGEGGYYYCAMGPLPDCLRSGPPTNLSKLRGPFYHIDLKDLVCLKGFYPSFYGNGPLLRYQGSAKDYSVNFNELVDHCITSPLTSEQLKTPGVSAKLFTQHLRPELGGKLEDVYFC